MLHKRACIAVLCSWVFAFPLLGDIIHVPSQYPTIQEGLNAAQTGDTVLVAAGTYVENIVWPSLDGIALMSESGPESTIVDGGSAGRVINFPNIAFTLSTVITGFTIQNGAATQGAGIYIYGSPSILENTIQGNTASASSGHVSGGGVLCDGIGAPSIERNLIRGNTASGPDWNYGAGIFVDRDNSAIILGNVIESDSGIGGSWNYGAGIYCSSESHPDIRHNTIHSNVAYQGSRGHGVGVYLCRDCDAYMLSNLIYDNVAQSGLWNYGAGILLHNDAVVLNNTIVGNDCTGGNWRYGGGVYISDSTSTIGNNIIANNTASGGGGIYAGTNGSALLLNNDVWNNTGGNYSGITPGLDDISLDPLFVTGPLGDFYLSQVAAGQGEDSPCVDYGFASAESLGLDTYTTRTDTVPDSGLVDLGYHYPTQPWVSVEEREWNAPISTSLFQVFPSVSSSSCRVQLVLDSSQYAEVHIFDTTGRLTQTLWKGKLASGKHGWLWTGLDGTGNKVSSGTYFFVVGIGRREISSRKVVLLR